MSNSTARAFRSWFVSTLLAVCMLGIAGVAGAAGTGGVRQALDAEFLFSLKDMTTAVDTSAFTPPTKLNGPSHEINGRLKIPGPSSNGHALVISDDDGLLLQDNLGIRQLPPLDAEFVQDGNNLIPVQRGPRSSLHPYWEWILEPGKAWDEAGDGGYSRATIPFSLQQRNQNCTHHGMLTFLFRSDGTTSRVAYQLVSETCIWLKADLWGVLELSYTPGDVGLRDKVVERHRQDVANRLPVRAIEKIDADYPGIRAAGFEPPSPEHATVWGLLIDGRHYMGGCQTRHGRYPFCDVIDLPSYSTAKSLFAGLAFMHLSQLHPGLGREKVSEWIPECSLADQRWRDVELRHLLDMTTGLYNSGEYMDDEDELTMTPFIQGDSHEAKVTFACQQYVRRSEPGQHWVYHSSDSYLAGLLMNRFLNNKSGADKDLFDGLLVPVFWKPLGLSAVSEFTRRSYDELSQPFTGYGLTFHPDDIVRVAQWLNSRFRHGKTGNLVDSHMAAAVMQESGRAPIPPLASIGLDYRNGFWAAEASSWVDCDEEVWIPFMSGFGGITVALLPNDTVYYYFSDSGSFRWAEAVIEAHAMRPICDA